MKKDYIIQKNKNRKHFTFSGIEVNIKDDIANRVSIEQVLQKVFHLVPKNLLSNIENIYIGQYEELNSRKIQAMYDKGNIFVTNHQSSESDLLDDLVHEIAHSVEDKYGDTIYSDGQIEKEFLFKRKKLWMTLGNKGFELPLEYFLETEYNEKFDMFLYEKVGYKLLNSIAAQIYYSAYAATSLREYFANGFEAFFLKEDIDRLKTISPNLFFKLKELTLMG